MCSSNLSKSFYQFLGQGEELSMATKCPVCGAPMENNGCGYCGYKEKTIPDSATVPPQSGQPIVQPQVVINNQTILNPGVALGVSKKNKMVALLLCIFLGGVGAHRFYVGKIGTGIIYLFTGGLFGIGWIVDIILIAVGSFKDKFDLPLRQ
jgi:hypothetical protein